MEHEDMRFEIDRFDEDRCGREHPDGLHRCWRGVEHEGHHAAIGSKPPGMIHEGDEEDRPIGLVCWLENRQSWASVSYLARHFIACRVDRPEKGGFHDL